MMNISYSCNVYIEKKALKAICTVHIGLERNNNIGMYSPCDNISPYKQLISKHNYLNKVS